MQSALQLCGLGHPGLCRITRWRASRVDQCQGRAWVQVDRGNVRAPPEVEEVYRGVAAPSRKAVTEEATVGDMPKAWLPCVTVLPLVFRFETLNPGCRDLRDTPRAGIGRIAVLPPVCIEGSAAQNVTFRMPSSY